MNRAPAVWGRLPAQLRISPDAVDAARLGLARRTASPLWRGLGVVVALVAGASAALWAPVSGADWWHVALGSLLLAHGPAAHAAFMASGHAAVDVRSWLEDVVLYSASAAGGAAGLAALAGLGGVLLGLGLALVGRVGEVHPLALIAAALIGGAALAPTLSGIPSLTLALLGVALVGTLMALRQGRRWATPALLALVVLWANLQSDAALAVLIIWGALLLGRWDRRAGQVPAAAPLWAVPASGLAVMLSPSGPAVWSHLYLSLGMGNESPLLTAWGSIDFHPWSARLAELAALLLLLSLWLGGKRLLRQDGWLLLALALCALLWSNYLPWFLVTATLATAVYLSRWLSSGLQVLAVAGRRGSSRAGLAIAALVLLAGFGALAHHALERGGPAGQTQRLLPVAAAEWLTSHPAAGAWYTTTTYGDYLAAQFPQGHHLVCLDAPLVMGARQLRQCQLVATLQPGTMAVLHSWAVRLAVLPRSAPQVAFLRAQGWTVRYRDSVSEVLTSPDAGL